MASIGEQLRSARESKGITLDEASKSLKISKKYLEALEEDNFNVFPAQIYARGFLKNYSVYLGLDPKLMLDQYDKVSVLDAQESERLSKTKVNKRRLSGNRFLMLLTAIVIAGFCLWLLYLLKSR